MQIQFHRFFIPEAMFDGTPYTDQHAQFLAELQTRALMVLDHGSVRGHWTDAQGNTFQVPGHVYEVGLNPDVQDPAAEHDALVQLALNLFSDQPYILTGEGAAGRLTARTS